MLILNEEKYAKTIYDGKNQDEKSIMSKVRYVTRYLLYTENMSDEENYQATVEWLKKHHDNFDESCYSNLISDAIKKAHKYPFYDIGKIKITKSELKKIKDLNNLRAEKVLFVLLCMAKQQSISNKFTDGLVKYSMPELCKMARISVPAEDREYILYYLVQKGFLGYPKKNNTQCLTVKLMDKDDDQKSELDENNYKELDENDCKELAYWYLNWRNDGKGYTRCQKCSRIIKQSKTKPRKYCEECAKYEPIGEKTVVCVDCGAEFVVDGSNKRTYRCAECQHKKQLEYQKIAMQRLRNQDV